jgi:5-hydroxyisourate hydrolase
MGRLTTHVLDTARGTPADGLTIELWTTDASPRLIKSVTTNKDGRSDAPILADADFIPATYELRFAAGSYLKRAGHKLTDPPFLDMIPIRFTIADASQHYHVPLLLSPFGYSTYRGS